MLYASSVTRRGITNPIALIDWPGRKFKTKKGLKEYAAAVFNEDEQDYDEDGVGYF
jgi:hypothetical protein